MMVIIQRMNDSRYQILITLMTVALLVNISPTIYAAWRFISSSYARGIQSNLSHHTALRFTLVLYFHLSSGLFHSPSESWNVFLISPCGLKILLISYFLTSSMTHGCLRVQIMQLLIRQLNVGQRSRVILSDKTYLSKCMLSHLKRGQIT
jgi:hypothetical protein